MAAMRPDKRLRIDGIQKLADRHEWKGFVTVDRRQDAKRGAVFVPGENMKAET